MYTMQPGAPLAVQPAPSVQWATTYNQPTILPSRVVQQPPVTSQYATLPARSGLALPLATTTSTVVAAPRQVQGVITSEQLLRSGNVVSERPISREALLQDGRITEGPTQRVPGGPRPADATDGSVLGTLVYLANDAYTRLPAASTSFTEASSFFSNLDPFSVNAQASTHTTYVSQPTVTVSHAPVTVVPSTSTVQYTGQYADGDAVPRPDFLLKEGA